jgi:hypothetical protein
MPNASKLIHDSEKRKYEVVWAAVAKKSIASNARRLCQNNSR